jgi:CheY-like chemotaxis protein
MENLGVNNNRTIESAIVIDDNRSDLLYNKMVLKKSGLVNHIATFVSGKSALAYFKKLLPDKLSENPKASYVIFLDLYMPRMDGFKFLEEFKTLGDAITKHFKIYLITNSTNPIDLQKASKVPFIYGFVRKPITRNLLEALKINS